MSSPKRKNTIALVVTTCLLLPIGVTSAQAINSEEMGNKVSAENLDQDTTLTEEVESRDESGESTIPPIQDLADENGELEIENDRGDEEPVEEKPADASLNEDTVSPPTAVAKTAPKANSAATYGASSIFQISPDIFPVPILLEGTNYPEITGNLKVGSTLKATEGKWRNAPANSAFHYTWLRDGKAIPGAIGKTYQTQKDDAAKKIRVSVEPVQEGFKASPALSPEKTVIGSFSNISPIVISSKYNTGDTLTLTLPKLHPAPASVSYQWLRNGTPITGATQSSYKIAESNAGSQISVKAVVSSPGYAQATLASKSNSILARMSYKSSAPLGELTTGSTIKSGIYVSTPSTTQKYQWTRNGANIPNATLSTYKLTTADREKKIAVKVTLSKSGYTTETVVSPHVLGSKAWFDQAKKDLLKIEGSKGVKLIYSETKCSNSKRKTEACTTQGIIFLTQYYMTSKYSKKWVLQHEIAHQYQFAVLAKLRASANFKNLFNGDLEYLANAMSTTRGDKMGTWTTAQLNYARGVYAGKV